MQLSAQQRFRAWVCLCVTDREREIPLLLSSKWSEFWTVIDGVPGWIAKFTETHPEHLAQADAGQLKRHHFDTCPTMMTSHPVHTGGGNRWFVSSAIYIGSFLKHLPPSKRCYDGRWKDEHMRSRNKSEGGLFQMTASACLNVTILFMVTHLCVYEQAWFVF